MEILVALLAIAAVGVVAYAVVRVVRSRADAAPLKTPSAVAAAQERSVTLPVDDADPSSPATQRLVNDAARRVFASEPGVTTVVVLSAGGRELGRVPRSSPEAAKPFVDIPGSLYEPHAPRHTGPHVTEDEAGARAQPRFEMQDRQTHRTLADHFDLPEAVRDRIVKPDDPVDIVRAILEHAGMTSGFEDGLIRYGDEALIVLGTPYGKALRTEDVNAAFLRFQQSGARRGVVVTAGILDQHDIRRRQALAPGLTYTGSIGIQRMADAVAMGADPLKFVVQTPLSET